MKHWQQTSLRMYLALVNRNQDHNDDRGAAMVEYALLVALIAIVVIAAAATLGGQLSETFSDSTLEGGLTN